MQKFLLKTFSSKYGKVFIFFTVVAVGVATVIGWNYYQGAQEGRWACLQRIEYAPRGYYLLDEEKRFGTQNEAVNYCLSEPSYKKPLNLSDYTTSTTDRGQIAVENQVGFGEALASSVWETVLQYVLFVVLVFGGFSILNRWLKRNTKRKALLYIGRVVGLVLIFVVFAFLILLINSLTGFSLFT